MIRFYRVWSCLGFGLWGSFQLGFPVAANPINSVFYITKNDNGNQIHYGIHLDRTCKPVGQEPAYVYWLRENGTTGDLLSVEKPAYGISHQSVKDQTVEIILSFFEGRKINKPITMKPILLRGGTCQAQAFTPIQGKNRQLLSMDIQLTRILRNPFTGSTIGGTVKQISLLSFKAREIISCQSACRFGL